MDRNDRWVHWFGGFDTKREALDQAAHSSRYNPGVLFRVQRAAVSGGRWNVMRLENNKGKYFWRP